MNKISKLNSSSHDSDYSVSVRHEETINALVDNLNELVDKEENSRQRYNANDYIK